ncbi:MAG: hypothetical protein COW30_14075 [Rhodospirillales bacterium CG15_BIG_FIL_POST_REV_8_21_14_020_66_15]|nr:MAG: hypothetical protein COW30_14075 [Rhodospirillales bacterium CG15_BIG_FIL_POST_REV_8_21_14_020_66_15]
MDAQVTVLHSDDVGRKFIAVQNGLVDQVYQHNLAFWKTRFNAEFTPEIKRQIVGDQSRGNSPYSAGTTQRLREIYADVSETGEFSMLEIGGANGTAIERIATRYPEPRIRYVGFECLPLLVEDFRKKHPGKTMHQGDIEDFIRMDEAPFADSRFTLLFASVVFVMIKPDLVREALRKAARLTDQFLIYDFMDHPVSDVPADHSLVVQVANRPVFWFPHTWERYMSEVGFSIKDRQVTELTGPQRRAFDPQLRGFGFLHAVRD